MSLSPAEYSYLSDPISANGTEMFKLTLQELCLKNVIDIEQKWVVVDKRTMRKRVRFFFSKSTAFNNYKTTKSHEKFLLDLFKSYPEFRFYQLRQYINKKFKKRGLELFKTKYVLNDLSDARFTFLKYFPNTKARELCKTIKKDLDFIESFVEDASKQEEISTLLEKLGTKIILLDKDTLEKLNKVSDSILKIESLSFLEILNRSFSQFDTVFFSPGIGFGGGISSFGGYGGFGGGSFGGGGAVGSW